MDLKELNHDYLNSLSEKLLREKNEHIILMGDFNGGLLKHTTDTSTDQFLDQLKSSSLLPQITSPTRISTKSIILIDNIFSSDSAEEPISGNIITSICDHSAKFPLLSIEKNKGSEKREIYKRNFKSLTRNELIEKLKRLDWDKVIRLNQNKTKKSL